MIKCIQTEGGLRRYRIRAWTLSGKKIEWETHAEDDTDAWRRFLVEHLQFASNPLTTKEFTEITNLKLRRK